MTGDRFAVGGLSIYVKIPKLGAPDGRYRLHERLPLSRGDNSPHAGVFGFYGGQPQLPSAQGTIGVENGRPSAPMNRNSHELASDITR